MTRFPLRTLLALLCALVALASACGDSDEESADTSEVAADNGESVGDDESTEGLDPEFVEQFQTQLAAIGCYDGSVDGIDGPATLAAIRRFQAAQGLTEDGVVGPETEGALQDAVEAGIQGCTADGDDVPLEEPNADDGEGALDGADGPQMTVTATNYENVFIVDVCDNPSETTITITATTEDGEGRVDLFATDGEGAISVTGNLLLEGDVTSAQVGDAGNFTIEGTFADNEFGDFVAEGSCVGV